MDSNDKIVMVYDLQTIGGKKTYNTLSGINQMFEKIKANKESFNGVFNINVDTSKLGQMDKLFADLIAEIRILTAAMKDLGSVGSKMAADIASAMAKVNMATLPNIIGFRQLQQTLSVNTGSVQGYNQALGQLGARLAEMRTDLSYTRAQMAELNKLIAAGTGDIEANTAYLERLTVSESKLKTEINEVTGAMTALNKVYNPGLLEEESAQLALNNVQLQQRAALLKVMAKVEDSNAGSVRGARAEIELLNREQENLIVTRTKDVQITDEEIAANIARRDAIIAEKNALHDFIAANADKNLSRVLNIGNYPQFTQLKTEFAELKAQMMELVLAGKVDGEEFAVLQAQALKLAASMKEVDAAMTKVNSSLKQGGGIGGKFASIVERMGLRMIANLLIFQAAIEVGQYLWEQWTKDSKAAEELAQKMKELDQQAGASAAKEMSQVKDLAAIASDAGQQMSIRLRAVKELQDKYPDYLGNLSQEAILTGNIATEMERLNKALLNKAYMEAAESKIQEVAKQYYKLFEEQKAIIEQENMYKKLLSGYPNRSEATPEEIKQKDDILLSIENQRIKAKEKQDEMDKLSHQMEAIQANASSFAKKAAGLIPDPKKKDHTKEPHDYTNAQLEAEKKLTDFIAKELEARLQFEMLNQKEIFDNTERSLAERLRAYAIYATDEKKLLQLQKDAEVKDVQDKVNKISEIETAIANKKAGKSYNKSFFDKSGTLKEQEQVLLINKDELNEQLVYLNTEYKTRLEKLNIDIGKGITAITTSSVGKILRDIEQDAATKIANLEDKATKAKGGVTGNKATRDSKTQDINLGLNVDKDNVELSANTEEQNTVQERLQEAHTAKRLDEEAAYQRQLTDLQNKAAALREKLRSDEQAVKEKDVEDDKLIQDALKNQSLQAFEEIGSAYINMLQQQQEARERYAQMAMDWNKKEQETQVQSNAQKQANDKAYFIAQQQLQREQFNDKKKLAQDQMAIDYATAVLKIVASNADLGPAAPAVDAIEIAGITAIYFAKLAMMNEQQYGQGGEVPTSGGLFGGRPHSAGGTKFVFQNRSFEAEAGELAIINKRTAASNQVMSVTGTPKQIASGINAWGGGYNFAPGAVMHKYEWGGSLGAQLQPPSFVNEYYVRKMENQYQSADIYQMVMANTEALKAHADALSRESAKSVVLNPHHVTDFQKSHTKNVKVGRL